MLRIATYNADLSAPGPGLLLHDLRKEDLPPQRAAVVAVIAALDADVLVLTGVDYDLRGEALDALERRLAAAGRPYPYRLALRPNTGVPTGRDLDRNGQLGEPRDAQGWGRFAGEGGIAVLSRLPIGPDVRDFSGFLWADLPGNLMPEDDPARDLQRLHTTGAYEVPIDLPGGNSLRLLVLYASPPVFDGPEDRNGRRNHDEAALWLRLLEGGDNRILKKIGEEAAEFVMACKDDNADEIAGEAADLVFHLQVALAHHGVPWRRVQEVLAARRGAPRRTPENG